MSAGPAGVAAAGAQLVFHITELLFESGDFLFLGFHFGVLIVDFVARELLFQGFLRVGIVLEIGFLAFALKEQEVAEYHYRFYHLLATVLGRQWSESFEARYSRLVREELNADVHGEVDEASWRLKQVLRRSQTTLNPKAFRAYARQSFVDTLTLYLHGICCDIDVDTGPRQLPSRYLRKRLMALQDLFPPPHGYAVFPEQLGP